MLHYVKTLTDKNHHCEARIYIAEQILQDEEMALCYKDIKKIRDRYNYLPQSVVLASYELDKGLLLPALIEKGLQEYWAAL